MKYVMKQRLLAFGDDFSVKTEDGRDVFCFDGKIGSFRKKVVVKDPNTKSEVAVILKKWLTFRPTFGIIQKGKEIATIYKKLASIRNAFVIDLPGPDNIEIIGKLVEHDYKFYRGKQQIAQVSKKWFTGRDTYGIDIESDRDALLVLSGAVVVDLLCHPKRDSSF